MKKIKTAKNWTKSYVNYLSIALIVFGTLGTMLTQLSELPILEGFFESWGGVLLVVIGAIYSVLRSIKQISVSGPND